MPNLPPNQTDERAGMVEAVAKALLASADYPIEADVLARAAIAAMRSPTQEMLKAGWKPNDFNPLAGDLVQATWQAMIDQALAEGSE